jgi:salicylate hydroxylase
LSITPNATRALQQLGVLPRVLDHADEVQHATAWAYDGAKLFQHPLGVAMTELYDAPYLVVSRRALQAALYDEAIRLGVAVLFGHNVALINTAEPSVTLETGIRIEADLVIGADGERSVCRKAVTGKHIRSNDSGHHIYLITVPNSSVQQAIPDIPLASPPCINFILGPGGHSVTYALPGSGLFHVLVVVKHTDIEDTPSLPHQVPLDIIKAIFQDWVVVKKLAEVATGCIQWTLLDTDLPEIWVKNNTVLVGDAAHAMLPFL